MELRQHNSESDQKKHTKMGDRVTGWRIKDGSLGPAGRSIDAASDQCHSHCFCLFLFQDVTIYNVYRYIYILNTEWIWDHCSEANCFLHVWHKKKHIDQPNHLKTPIQTAEAQGSPIFSKKSPANQVPLLLGLLQPAQKNIWVCLKIG